MTAMSLRVEGVYGNTQGQNHERCSRGAARIGIVAPGWVAQLPRSSAQKRFYRVVASAEHPEVRELVVRVMTKLGWEEDLDGAGTSVQEQASKRKAPALPPPVATKQCHMWNLLWTWTSRVRVPETQLFAWQRINHFQECRCALLPASFNHSCSSG